MIFDKFEKLSRYGSLHPKFKKAFEFLTNTDLGALTTGKHTIDGENIYASVNEYLTKEEGYLESHRKHIDIQLITKGKEKIGFAFLNGQEVKENYDESKDLAFYFGDCDYLILIPGTFAIFFPEDLHKPGIAAEQTAEVKKIVIKVKI
ncbi:MAG: YhcH/YjgK/YiaL family protein [Candidatus Delongbacteria bacterium]|nr:YhcH/YjgK/YiaL family protein [Candidatus Delongbacteria bacterium]